MESVLKTVGVYFFLLLLFRIAGKRSLHDITLFDFVLLLVLSESVQGALIGEDFSLTNAWIVLATFFLLDVTLSVLKQRFPKLGTALDGMSVLIVRNGRPLKEKMNQERIDEEDILEAARQAHGLTRLEQIKYAVLERNGSISIVPQRKEA
jgi:uncharacterized membrane protein YcaP (DUF421 family)